MFTGIVEEIGVVSGINRTQGGIRLLIKTDTIYSDAKAGDSISVSGACLTISDIKDNILGFDVIEETLKRTTLAELRINDFVNLERSLRADSRIGGHFVSGHIDYRGRIDEIIKQREGTGFRVSMPEEFSKFIVEKGSVALDGVSLTVADVGRQDFTIYLIPHTLKLTTLGRKKKGDLLNVEIDLLAKYLARQVQKSSLEDLLKKYDYI